MTKKKVYCKDCKYYIPECLRRGIFESCIKASYVDTYHSQVKIKPYVKNKNNDCKDYEPKEV